MPNHMKACGCRQCRKGMHTKAGGATVRAAVRKKRKAVKAALKKGTEPPDKGSVPYTD